MWEVWFVFVVLFWVLCFGFELCCCSVYLWLVGLCGKLLGWRIL